MVHWPRVSYNVITFYKSSLSTSRRWSKEEYRLLVWRRPLDCRIRDDRKSKQVHWVSGCGKWLVTVIERTFQMSALSPLGIWEEERRMFFGMTRADCRIQLHWKHKNKQIDGSQRVRQVISYGSLTTRFTCLPYRPVEIWDGRIRNYV